MEAIRIWIITQLFVYGCKEERMGIRRCENGHYYDDEKFFRCPYCGINIDLEDEIDSDQDKTVSIIRKTMMIVQLWLRERKKKDIL